MPVPVLVVDGDDGDGFQCCIRYRGRIGGVIGFYRVDWFHRSVEVGYWLAEELQGRGLVTRACRALVAHAFGSMDVHRVEIRAGVDNRRSRAVAERLGFRHEGTLREAQRIGERFVDLASNLRHFTALYERILEDRDEEVSGLASLRGDRYRRVRRRYYAYIEEQRADAAAMLDRITSAAGLDGGGPSRASADAHR